MSLNEALTIQHLSRIQVDEYDHDCPQHQPGVCVPTSTRALWFLDGVPVTAPEEIARLEIRLREQMEATHGEG